MKFAMHLYIPREKGGLMGENIMQYGIADAHFANNDDKTVDRINNVIQNRVVASRIFDFNNDGFCFIIEGGFRANDITDIEKEVGAKPKTLITPWRDHQSKVWMDL